MIIHDDGENRIDSKGPDGKKQKPSVMFLVILILVLIGMPVILAPKFLRARTAGSFTQCQSNCKNIGTALEMYSVDNNGDYPDDLFMLTPKYLKVIPTCYRAKKDTYSASYQRSHDMKAYTFYCKGHNHKNFGVPPNFPQYNSTSGLTAR